MEVIFNEPSDFKMPRRRGNTLIEVLPSLIGKEWSAVAEGYIASVRPSAIRFVTGDDHDDSGKDWQVDVFLEESQEKHIIRKIVQHVQVGLPKGIAHARALKDGLHCGIDSQEVRWWNNAENVYSGKSGLVKQVGKKFYSYPDEKEVEDPLKL